MNREALHKIFCIGLYRFSKSLKIQKEKDSAIREAVYCFHNAKDKLPEPLLVLVAESTDDYYRGFCTDNFAEIEKEILLPLLEENTELEASLVEWYRVRQALKLVDVEVSFRDVLFYAKEERELLNSEGQPMISVNAKFIQNRVNDAESDKRTGGKKLNAKKRAMLAMYFGILSIIGNKRYAATTSEFILCRMFGAKNEEELSLFREDREFDELYNTYATRRKYYSLMTELEKSGLVTQLSHNKRTYVSVKIKSVEALADAIHRDSKEAYRKELSERKKAAKEKYLKRR